MNPIANRFLLSAVALVSGSSLSLANPFDTGSSAICVDGVCTLEHNHNHAGHNHSNQYVQRAYNETRAYQKDCPDGNCPVPGHHHPHSHDHAHHPGHEHNLGHGHDHETASNPLYNPAANLPRPQRQRPAYNSYPSTRHPEAYAPARSPMRSTYPRDYSTLRPQFNGREDSMWDSAPNHYREFPSEPIDRTPNAWDRPQNQPPQRDPSDYLMIQNSRF